MSLGRESVVSCVISGPERRLFGMVCENFRFNSVSLISSPAGVPCGCPRCCVSLRGRCVLSLFPFVEKVPVLVLEAGLDRLVRSDGIERFRRRVPQAKYRLFDSAYHDLFDETDDIR